MKKTAHRAGGSRHASRITITGNRNGLDRLADRYAHFAARYKIPASIRRDMYVALEEIVSNVVRHGTCGARSREISVVLELESSAFRIRITDDGPKFDPFSVAVSSVDRQVLERPIGGLGIVLVEQLTDEHTYSRRGGRNHVKLRRVLRRR